jgi:hypothetical protein
MASPLITSKPSSPDMFVDSYPFPAFFDPTTYQLSLDPPLVS